jgi:hypothetical protein
MYDLIGDIHGHADALRELLQKLGYELHEGVYRHYVANDRESSTPI